MRSDRTYSLAGYCGSGEIGHCSGGTPVEFPAIGICDGIAMGHAGMKYPSSMMRFSERG